MKRPLWVIGVSLLASILVGFLFSVTAAFSVSLLLAVGGIVLGITKVKHGKPAGIILLSLSMGMAIAGYNNQVKQLPFNAYKGENLRVIGIITEVHHSSQRSTRLTLKANFPGTTLPSSNFVIRDYMDSELKLGNRIDSMVKFADSKYESINQRHRQQGVPGEGSFVAPPTVIANTKADSFDLWLLGIREDIRGKIYKVLPETSGEIVSTMVFGLKENLAPQVYLDLAKTGTIHVLSVSGMHLSVFTMFLLFVMQTLKVRKKLSIFTAIIANVGFTVLVGFSAPIVRSAIMSVMFLLAELIGRENDSLNALGLSLVVIGVLWPHWVLSWGMWLSFLSTAGIIILGKPLKDYLDKKIKTTAKWQRAIAAPIIGGICVTSGAILFTFPLITFLSGYLSVISLVANLLVEPFTTVIIIVGVGLVALPVGFPLYPLLRWLVDFSVKAMLEISSLLSKLPFATLPINSWALFSAFIITIGLLIYAVIKMERKTTLPALFISITLLCAGSGFTRLYNYNSIKVSTTLPTTSAILIRGENAVVIGTPDKYEVVNLIEYLSFEGVKSIDCLIINDHPSTVGSSLALLKANFAISSVVGPADETVLKELAGVLPGVQVHSGENISLEFLGGATSYIGKDSHNVNLVVGRKKIVITDTKYDIIKGSGIIYLLKDTGEIVGTPQLRSDPISTAVFGESSITIKL